MPLSFFLFQAGAFTLGITFTFAILFHVAANHAKADRWEGCLGVLLCTVGVGIAFLCYATALNI